MSTPAPKKKKNQLQAIPPSTRKTAKTRTTSKTRGRKKTRVVTQRVVSARLEKYHAYFSEMFRDQNPKKRYPSHAQIAKKLGYSKSMVRRDVFHMQHDHQLPLEFIEEYGGWGYTEDVVKAPTLRMTKSDLVLICAAWSALEGVRGTPLADRAADAFKKLIEALGGETGFDLHKVRDRISFRATNYYAPVDPEVFEAVSEALFDDEELRFTYRKVDRRPPGKRTQPMEPEHRHVQPRHLLNHDGAWYLYCNDVNQGGKLRKFALSRMSGVRRTGFRFEPKTRFNIDEEMKPGFGVHNTGLEETVRLRFIGASAQFVAERHWHGTQKLTLNPDESLDMTLCVVPAPELDHWLFRWEDEVEIIEPASIREALLTKLLRMVSAYEKSI